MKLEFSELKLEMKVRDDNGNIGIIKKFKDINNVVVKFEKTGGGGYGFYCLDENDKKYYDPLYKRE